MNQIELKNTRIKILSKAWDKYVDYLDDHIKTKMKKNTAAKRTLLKMVERLKKFESDDSLKMAIIRKYISSCKTFHSMAFFKWRSMFS